MNEEFKSACEHLNAYFSVFKKVVEEELKTSIMNPESDHESIRTKFLFLAEIEQRIKNEVE